MEASGSSRMLAQISRRCAAASRLVSRHWLAPPGACSRRQTSRATWGGVAATAARDAGTWRQAATAAAAVPTPLAPSPAAPSGAAQPQLQHLEGLSREQLAAVTAPLGTVRVVAGPGSGKTRVLTSRIAHLIRAHGAQPWQVLAITFTNKAANEMKERLAGMLGEEAGKDLFAGTFHSLCYRILKRHIRDLPGSGRTPAFNVYDEDMALRAMAGVVRAANPEWKGREVNQEAASLMGEVSRVKNRMLTWHEATPREVAERVAAHLAKEDHPPSQRKRHQDVVEYFEKYEAAMRAANALDFDDLTGLAVALLRRVGSVREAYNRRFRHVLVDEFQDTNTAQYELVRLLAPPPHQQSTETAGATLFIVGDPDQSIYGFRGAVLTNMTHEFAKDYRGAKVCALTDNYRSTARIVATAHSVISRNDDWQRAGLRPRRHEGALVEVRTLVDEQEEAAFIARSILDMLRRGEHPEEEIAVLMRTHRQARLVEQELVLRNIHYVVIGGKPFWKRTEIQDVMAYLRLAVGLCDELALGRIINRPKRALGDTSVDRLKAHAKSCGLTLPALLFGDRSEAASADAQPAGLPPLPDRTQLGLTAKAAAALEEFRRLALALHGAVRGKPLGQAMQAIIKQTAYEQHVMDGGCGSSGKKGEDKGIQERIERLKMLVEVAGAYSPGELSGAGAFSGPGWEDGEEEAGGGEAAAAGSPAGRLDWAQNFLDEAALYSSAEEGGKGARGVRLMTMHASKGLEFEAVFVPGLNEGLVPSLREQTPEEIYEERRLFYVSMTRAKERLCLLSTRLRKGFDGRSYDARPSRFLDEVVKSGHADMPGHEARSSSGSTRSSSSGSGPGQARRRSSGGSGSSNGSGGSTPWQHRARRHQSEQEWRSGSGAGSNGSSAEARRGSSPGGSAGDAELPQSAARQAARRRGGRR